MLPSIKIQDGGKLIEKFSRTARICMPYTQITRFEILP
jgi:hypothetical protein